VVCKLKVLKKNRGFTLTELIIVIAIIGVLSAILIPAITDYVRDAKISSDEQEARAIYNIYNNYKLEYEHDLTANNFFEYYEEITGEELVPYPKDPKNPKNKFWLCTSNYVCLYPHSQGLPDFDLMKVTEYFVYKGHYYTVINAETGEIIESGRTDDPVIVGGSGGSGGSNEG
jgi:prepilin-type N-terminal cleavage/methylation domain-containing protein